MNSLALFSAIFILGEAVSFLVFKSLNFFFFGYPWEFRLSLSVIKGALERLFLFLSLVLNVPHALIAFGAIKVGTRIRPDEKITNDYFFVGNMLSLLISVFYFLIWKRIT